MKKVLPSYSTVRFYYFNEASKLVILKDSSLGSLASWPSIFSALFPMMVFEDEVEVAKKLMSKPRGFGVWWPLFNRIYYRWTWRHKSSVGDHSLKLWLHEVCVKNGNSSTITDWYLKLLLMMEAVHKKKCHSCCCFQVEDDLTRGYYFGAIGYGTRAEMKKRSWCISFNLLTALRKIFACWICKVAISSADPLPEPFSFCFPPCALFAVFLSILRLLMLIEM